MEVIRNIHYLRAAAAVMVLLFHMAWLEGRATLNGGVLPHWLRVGDSGVDLFFVISGFIMIHIQKSPLGSVSSCLRFLLRRFSRIFPPYWIVSAALLPLWLIQPGLFNNHFGNQVDIVRSFLLLPQDFTPLLSVGWTLIHEVYFYLVVSVALLFGTCGRVTFGLVWFALVALGHRVLENGQLHECRILQLVFSPFSLTFLLGYFLGLSRPLICKYRPIFLWGILSAAVVALVIAAGRMPPVGVYPDNNHLLRFLTFGIPCALVVGSLVALEQGTANFIKPLGILGDASYVLYLSHLPLVGAFYMVLGRTGIRDPIGLVFAALVCFGICIGTAVLFHRCIESRLLRISRNLIDQIIPPPSRF